MLYLSLNAPDNTDDLRARLIYGVAREAGQHNVPVKGYAILGAVEFDQAGLTNRQQSYEDCSATLVLQRAFSGD